MSNPLFEYLNDINVAVPKRPDVREFDEKLYKPYIINRFLSGTIDTVLLANEMNIRHSLDPKMQYDFLRHVVRKKKRFTKWLKPETFEILEELQKYYQIGIEKAKEFLPLHTKEQLDHIHESMDIGGVKSKKRQKSK